MSYGLGRVSPTRDRSGDPLHMEAWTLEKICLVITAWFNTRNSRKPSPVSIIWQPPMSFISTEPQSRVVLESHNHYLLAQFDTQLGIIADRYLAFFHERFIYLLEVLSFILILQSPGKVSRQNSQFSCEKLVPIYLNGIPSKYRFFTETPSQGRNC